METNKLYKLGSSSYINEIVVTLMKQNTELLYYTWKKGN
jgi:hypothetical protein